jgi:hypothetical protein
MDLRFQCAGGCIRIGLPHEDRKREQCRYQERRTGCAFFHKHGTVIRYSPQVRQNQLRSKLLTEFFRQIRANWRQILAPYRKFASLVGRAIYVNAIEAAGEESKRRVREAHGLIYQKLVALKRKLILQISSVWTDTSKHRSQLRAAEADRTACQRVDAFLPIDETYRQPYAELLIQFSSRTYQWLAWPE